MISCVVEHLLAPHHRYRHHLSAEFKGRTADEEIKPLDVMETVDVETKRAIEWLLAGLY